MYKSSTMAFVTPSITELVIDIDVLLAGWLAGWLVESERNQKILFTTTVLEDAPVSTAAREVHEEFFLTKALAFTTPAKRKRDMDGDGSPVLSLLNIKHLFSFLQA
jgi:hypothetical protein